jgi:predicted Kef-type K+ transport protein
MICDLDKMDNNNYFLAIEPTVPLLCMRNPVGVLCSFLIAVFEKGIAFFQTLHYCNFSKPTAPLNNANYGGSFFYGVCYDF